MQAHAVTFSRVHGPESSGHVLGGGGFPTTQAILEHQHMSENSTRF